MSQQAEKQNGDHPAARAPGSLFARIGVTRLATRIAGRRQPDGAAAGAFA
jgi:hypothetical protein